MEKKLTKEAQQIIDEYNKEYPNDPKKAEDWINWKLKYIQKYYYEKNEQERKIIKKSMKYVGQGEYIRKKLNKEFDFKGFSNKKGTLEYIQQLERKLYYKLKKYHIEQDPNIDKITLEKYYRQEIMYIIEHTSYAFFPLTKKSKIKTIEYISKLLNLLSCNLSKRKFVYENQGEIIRKILKKKFDFRSIVNKQEIINNILKLEREKYYSLIYYFREQLNKLNSFYIEKKYKSRLLECFKESCLKKTYIFDLDGFKYDFDVKSKTPISPLFYIKQLNDLYSHQSYIYNNAGDIIRDKLNIKLNLKKIEDLKEIRKLEKELHFYYKKRKNFNVKILYEMVLSNIIKKSISPFSFFSKKVNSNVYIDNLKNNIRRQKEFATGDYGYKLFSDQHDSYTTFTSNKEYYKYFFDRNRHCQYEEHWHAIYPNLLFDIKEKFDSWAFHIDFEYNIYIYEIIDDIQYNIKKILDKDEFSEEEDKLNFTEKILTCIHIFFLVIWLIMRILQGLLVPIFKKKKEFDE